MSEQVRKELTADVDAAEESGETRHHLAFWTAVGAAGTLAVVYGFPALVKATAPDCNVVMRADDTDVQGIHLPDDRVLYGDVFSTGEGMRVIINLNNSINFNKQQVDERAMTEYDAGNGVMVKIQVVDADTIQTSC